jgi:hypothetical protein
VNLFCVRQRPTACVTCVWAGVDSVWEQEKLEARKMLENAADSHTSGARFVGQFSDIYKTFNVQVFNGAFLSDVLSS